MTILRTPILILSAVAALALPCAPPPARAQRPEVQSAATDKFERGKQLFDQGSVESAIPLLRDAAELREKDAGAWYIYGLALNRADRPKDARKAFEKTLKLRPDDAAARTAIAYALLRLNKAREAEREAHRALNILPQNAEARYILSAIRYQQARFDEAAQEAEAALLIKPDLTAAAFLASDALLKIYVAEEMRQAEKYPLIPDSSEVERKTVFERREPAVEPIKARMLEAAARFESFVKSQPSSPAIEQWRELAETLRIYGRRGGDTTGSVLQHSEVTTKAVITHKPDPGFTEEARARNVTGTVRLRAVLSADGAVRHILVVKRLPDGLTEKSIEAARRIKFNPAMRDGRPVSQFITLEYNFNVR